MEEGGAGGLSHPPAALPAGKTRYPLYIGGWEGGGGTSVLDECTKLSLTGIRSPDRPARGVVVIPTTLSRPTFLLFTDLITCILHTNL
jgi:hypothetical protein